MTIALAEAKLHLRVDQNDEDALIQIYLDAAKDYAKEYLNRASLPNNPSVDAAILLVVGDLYENREGAGEKEIKSNPAVEKLLHPYREELGI